MLSNIRHVDLGVLRGVATAFTFLGNLRDGEFPEAEDMGMAQNLLLPYLGE